MLLKKNSMKRLRKSGLKLKKEKKKILKNKRRIKEE
jgi:hypothetical protein